MLIFNSGLRNPVAAGAAGTPSLNFGGEQTGLFLKSAGVLGISTIGSERVSISTDTINILNDAGMLSIGSFTHAILQKSADYTLSLINGINPMYLRVYGTTTGPKYSEIFHDGANGYFRSQSGSAVLGSADGNIYFAHTGVANLWVIATAGGLTAGGNHRLAHGTSALLTTATEGYLFIQSCAGAPTGVPASIPSGQKAMVYDSTNNKLYIYSGGWKKAQVTAVDAIYA